MKAGMPYPKPSSNPSGKCVLKMAMSRSNAGWRSSGIFEVYSATELAGILIIRSKIRSSKIRYAMKINLSILVFLLCIGTFAQNKQVVFDVDPRGYQIAKVLPFKLAEHGDTTVML